MLISLSYLDVIRIRKDIGGFRQSEKAEELVCKVGFSAGFYKIYRVCIVKYR